MNTCFQLTNNGNVNSQTEGGLCNSVTKYKEIFSDANLNKAIKGPYDFSVTGTQNAWATCMFYVGPELPRLQQYADIEAKYPNETNYGGRYIQLRWQPTTWHISVGCELYITRKFSY